MNSAILIQGGRLLDPARGTDAVGDIYVENGLIAPVPGKIPADARRIAAAGLVVAPGFIDLHVHFREPGNEAAETVETGSKAAARGGFTTVVTMPNTTPATDSAALIRRTAELGAKAHCVNVLPSGCITRGRRGVELADMSAMTDAGAVAFTDDGSTVPDRHLMELAMRKAAELRRPIMDHALDPAIAGKGVVHDGPASRAFGLPGIPSEAEVSIVRRDIELARITGCAVHIQHISCAQSVALIRAAQGSGLLISGEATPHHLTLTDSDIRADDTNFKMSPPLRSEADRQAIIAGVADGTIQAFATDHAPHTAQSKARGFLDAPSGIVGLETAVAVTYMMVRSRLLGLADWVKRWTTGPATILGTHQPSLAIGEPADLVLLDLNKEWVVKPEEFASKSRNSPFAGRKYTGKPVLTILRGSAVSVDSV